MPEQSKNSIPPYIHENFDAIVEAKQTVQRSRSLGEIAFDWIGGLIGTMSFVGSQLLGVSLRVAINSALARPLGPFDPFPFPLLSLILTFEAVLMAAFVLMKQNRMSKIADRRAHLDLQII